MADLAAAALSRSGLTLETHDGFPIDAIGSAFRGGTTGDIGVMRHLRAAAQPLGDDETAYEAVLLLAIAGMDADASAIARGDTDAMNAACRHALSLMGPGAIDQYVVMAIAPVMDDCSVIVTDGRSLGASVIWNSDEVTIWTDGGGIQTQDDMRHGFGIHSNGSIIVPKALPDTLCHALTGRLVADLSDHPMLPSKVRIQSVDPRNDHTIIWLDLRGHEGPVA